MLFGWKKCESLWISAVWAFQEYIRRIVFVHLYFISWAKSILSTFITKWKTDVFVDSRLHTKVYTSTSKSETILYCTNLRIWEVVKRFVSYNIPSSFPFPLKIIGRFQIHFFVAWQWMYSLRIWEGKMKNRPVSIIILSNKIVPCTLIPLFMHNHNSSHLCSYCDHNPLHFVENLFFFWLESCLVRSLQAHSMRQQQ